LKQSNRIISTGHARPPDLEGEQDPFAADGIESEVEYREVLVTAQLDQQRLDRALAELVPEFSRSYLQQLLAQGCVQCNARTQSKASARVRVGDQLVVELRPTPQSQAFRPEPMALQVVFEDAHLLVLDKPAGLVVHPAPGNWSGTLLNALLAHHAGAAHLPRAGIVHRLDKDTSGLMVVAKTRAVMDALVGMIAARDVSRQYLAVAHRPWSGPPRRRVEEAIGRDPRNRLRMAALDPERHPAKPATTDVDLLDSTASGCWVRCTLHTGRTHQIRVHMAWLGHPLVGDALYGGASAAGMGRQALHAYRLAFLHPVSRAEMVFQADLPADMRNALHAWGLRYNISSTN
jgi:23S rRNA pseudouridine1911/1915/1917 synthase